MRWWKDSLSRHWDALCTLAGCQVTHSEKIEEAQHQVCRREGDDLTDINRSRGLVRKIGIEKVESISRQR
jgi:endonuclease V-like protein UPF0215 family